MNKGNPKIRLYSHLGGKAILEKYGKNHFSELIKKRWDKKRSDKINQEKEKNESIH